MTHVADYRSLLDGFHFFRHLFQRILHVVGFKEQGTILFPTTHWAIHFAIFEGDQKLRFSIGIKNCIPSLLFSPFVVLHFFDFAIRVKQLGTPYLNALYKLAFDLNGTSLRVIFEHFTFYFAFDHGVAAADAAILVLKGALFGAFGVFAGHNGQKQNKAQQAEYRVFLKLHVVNQIKKALGDNPSCFQPMVNAKSLVLQSYLLAIYLFQGNLFTLRATR